MKEFGSPSAFARYLEEMKGRLAEAEHKGLETAGKLVLEEVQQEVGTYQGAVNGLAAWAELADATKADRSKKGYSDNDPLLRTGHMRDSYAFTVGDHKVTIGSDDPIAGYQEFGTADAKHPIPPRPVLGGSLFRRADDAVKAAVAPTIRLLEGK